MTITGPRCIKARVASNRMSLSVYNSYETRLGKRPVMGGSVDRTPPPRDHLPAADTAHPHTGPQPTGIT